MPSGLKVTLGLVISIVIVLGIFASFYFGTDLPEDQINGFLRKKLESRYGLRVTVGRLHRKIWPAVRLSDVSLSLARNGKWHRVGNIESLEVEYRLWDLVRGRWNFPAVSIDRPQIVVERDQQGRLILPPGPSRKEDQSRGRANSPFELGRLELKDGSLSIRGPESSFDFKSVDLFAKVEGRVGTLLAQIDRFSFELPGRDFTLERLAGGVRVVGEIVSLNHIEVQTAESNLILNGVLAALSPPKFSLRIAAPRVSFAELSRFMRPDLRGVVSIEGEVAGTTKEFQGQATIDGTFLGKKFEKIRTDYSFSHGRIKIASLEGRIFEAPFSGDGYLDLATRPETYGFHGRTRKLNLGKVISGKLRSDFTGRLKMEGKGLSRREMQMRLFCDLEAGSIDRYSFGSASGDMIITAQKLQLLSGFQVRYKNSKVVLGGYLEYKGRINLTANAELYDLDDFDRQIFLSDLGGRAQGRFHLGGQTQDFNIRGFLRSDSCWVYGFQSSDLFVDLSCDNFLSHKRGMVHIYSGPGSAWSFPVSKMEAFLGVDGDLYELDSVAVTSRDMRVELAGRLEAGRTPRELQLKYLNLFLDQVPVYSRGRQLLVLGEEDIELRRFQFTFGEGRLSIGGKITDKQNLNLTLEGEGVDLLPLAGLAMPSMSLLGKLSFNGVVKGDLASPIITASARIDGLNLEGVDMGSLNVDLSYRNQLLDFRNLTLEHQREYYSGSGFIPVNLSLGRERSGLKERPIGFFLQARGEQLSMLSSLVEELEYLLGDFQADVVVSGTVKHPQFEGRLNLSNGTLKLADFQEPISKLQMALRLQDNIVHVEGISGRLESQPISSAGLFRRLWGSLFPGKDRIGTIRLSGTIEVLDLNTFNYNLVLSGRDVPLTHAYLDFSAVSDFDLTLKGFPTPTVAGKVHVKQLLYQEPFSAVQSQSRELPPAVDSGSWDLDLEVIAANNIWIKNPDLDAEFKSQLEVHRRSGQYQILGELEAIRGNAFIYGNRFDIVSGKMTFDNITKIDPRLDFETEIRTYYSGREEFAQGERTYSVYITGTLSAPQLGFAVGGGGSQREMSQQEILESIALNRPLYEDTTQVSYDQALGERAQGIFSSYLTKYLEAQAANALGVETFWIRTPTNHGLDLRDTEVTVGQYISPNVYLRYSRRLSLTSAQEIAAEYRLSRRLSLEGKYDKDRFFHFDLSMNWEF